jgi:hypothetical protein
VTDIFHEVEQDLRQARLKKLWDEYGPYLIGGVVLALVIVSGTVFWRSMTQAAAERASLTYTQAAEALNTGEYEEAAASFGALGEDAPDGYRVLARLQAGIALARSGETESALAELDAAAEAEGIYGDMARLTAAQIRADDASSAALQDSLASLLEPGHALEPFARELVSLALYREGDYAGARVSLRGLIENLATPPALRERAQALDVLIASRYGADLPDAPEVPAAE